MLRILFLCQNRWDGDHNNYEFSLRMILLSNGKRGLSALRHVCFCHPVSLFAHSPTHVIEKQLHITIGVGESCLTYVCKCFYIPRGTAFVQTPPSCPPAAPLPHFLCPDTHRGRNSKGIAYSHLDW